MGNKQSDEMASDEAIAWVEGIIKDHRVAIFSKPFSPYCRKAKNAIKKCIRDGVITEKDVRIEEISSRPDCCPIQNYMEQKTGARTVPRVFINGKCVGGGNETQALFDSGELLKESPPAQPEQPPAQDKEAPES